MHVEARAGHGTGVGVEHDREVVARRVLEILDH
jgi:hypothetical protein